MPDAPRRITEDVRSAGGAGRSRWSQDGEAGQAHPGLNLREVEPLAIRSPVPVVHGHQTRDGNELPGRAVLEAVPPLGGPLPCQA